MWKVMIVILIIEFHITNAKLKSYNINPDEYLDVPQIIRRHGYTAESHTVQTEDGYLLELHRIPKSKDGRKGGQPILLQHGLLGSSADWIMNGNTTLGFFLSDKGYDVWLGNCRGNTYSRAHVLLPKSSPQFWNFSWHEMAIYDLPAVLYHISNVTEKPGEILYIGHSMGTTQFFVLSSILPEVAKTVKLMVALAPVAYTSHLKSSIRYLAPFANDFQWLQRYLGLNEFLPHWKLFDLLAYDCNKRNDKKICQNVLFVIGGFQRSEFNLDILSTVIGHDPAGASTKTLLHYVQEIKNGGSFQQYDYGVKGNLIKYGTPTPPQYKLENIKRPIYLMYAQNDILATPVDVERLSKKLPNLKGLYKVPQDVFDHIDFIFGKDAYSLVYKPILNILKKYTIY